jgi:hypothetical protein
MKSTLKITKWGNFKDSKWSRHKIKTFRGARDFFGPLNCMSDSEDHFGTKKVKGPFKSGDVLNLQHPAVMFETSNITRGEEIVKSTLFCKVYYVLYSGIKLLMYKYNSKGKKRVEGIAEALPVRENCGGGGGAWTVGEGGPMWAPYCKEPMERTNPSFEITLQGWQPTDRSLPPGQP